jgi:hypothetical protein
LERRSIVGLTLSDAPTDTEGTLLAILSESNIHAYMEKHLSEFKFNTYGAKELDRCGKLFCAAARDFDLLNPACDAAGWTDFVLGWFQNTAQEERILVDARRPRAHAPVLKNGFAPKNTEGEFLVDLAHSTYPHYSEELKYNSLSWWKEALKHRCQVRLALESEWGKNGKRDMTRVAILQDAIKLAAFRADAKVMVFGSHGDDRAGIVNDLKRLRSKSKDDSPWLWIDVPWHVGKDGLHADHGVLK